MLLEDSLGVISSDGEALPQQKIRNKYFLIQVLF